MRRLLLAIALAAALPAGAAAPPEDKVTTQLRAAAEAGDARAQYRLGRIYQLGKGVPVDVRSAISWYRRAADQGDMDAVDGLGLLLFRDGQQREAMPWILRAAAAGESRALYVLGTAHFNGDYVSRDWPQAYAEMSRAAVAGLPEAERSLQQMQHYMTADDQARGKTIAARFAKLRAFVPDGSASPAAATARAAPLQPRPPQPAPGSAQSRPTPAPPQPAASAPSVTATVPAPAPSKTVPQRSASAPKTLRGRWRVQLGAFATEGGARTAWSGLSAKVPALGGVTHELVHAGTVVRLQANGLADGAAAKTVCRAVAARGGACFPVGP